ncbi:hypothetical protein IAR50_007277 [Cryptococcus sp. DSM 104548]
MPRSPDRSEDYNVRPSKIRLKTTKSEKAEKIFNREKRRFEKDQHRISRANGYAVSPPSSSRYRDDSISPPRNKPRPQARHYEEEEGDDGEWLGAFGRKVREGREEREKMAWEEKMRWMAGSEAGDRVLDDYEDLEAPRWGHAGPEPESLPSRWRSSASKRPFLSPSLFPPPPSFFSPKSRPSRPKLYHFPSQPPPMGAMSDADYADYIRSGMYAQKNASALLEEDRRRTERMEREEKREKERARREREDERWRRKQEREEWERYERRKREREEAEEAYRPAPPPREDSATPPYHAAKSGHAKKDDPAKWTARWQALQAGGEIEPSNLTFRDIPWPIFLSSLPSSHTPDDILSALSLENVKKYMVTVASYKDNTGGEPGKVRRVVREAVRSFHPDRFTVRVLERVKEGDKQKVKEGADVVSRVLNDLAKQYK